MKILLIAKCHLLFYLHPLVLEQDGGASITQTLISPTHYCGTIYRIKITLPMTTNLLSQYYCTHYIFATAKSISSYVYRLRKLCINSYKCGQERWILIKQIHDSLMQSFVYTSFVHLWVDYGRTSDCMPTSI